MIAVILFIFVPKVGRNSINLIHKNLAISMGTNTLRTAMLVFNSINYEKCNKTNNNKFVCGMVVLYL